MAGRPCNSAARATAQPVMLVSFFIKKKHLPLCSFHKWKIRNKVQTKQMPSAGATAEC